MAVAKRNCRNKHKLYRGERMMITTRTGTVKSIAAHSIHMVVLLIFAVISTHSFFYNLKYIQGTENIIIEIITASLATLLWGVLYFEVRALTAVLYADNSGIGIQTFFRQNESLS